MCLLAIKDIPAGSEVDICTYHLYLFLLIYSIKNKVFAFYGYSDLVYGSHGIEIGIREHECYKVNEASHLKIIITFRKMYPLLF